MFPQSFYKSYALSFIEKARYDRLTQWLDNLTVHDLSLVNTDGIDTIDAWGGLSSIKHIARYIQPGIDLITLDPKLSSTIVGKEGFDSESTMQEVAHGIARDAGMYNQETCTNARVVYVQSGIGKERIALANRLGELLWDGFARRRRI